MPETISDKTVFSLLEVSLSVRKTLAERYTSAFWVTAEMNKLNHYPQSGHCYPELVEKADGKVVAQLRGILWKTDYVRIDTRFQQVLKEPLRNGIKILFCAKITFDPAHGLSLTILDIDPVYSLGELEKEKMETIGRLKKDNMYDKNRLLPFPLLPKRIALISVETSKGYADFLSILDGNEWGYHFFHMLFPALLQGEKAIPSIRGQLSRIKKVIAHFDVVAIIRGGGGDVGLSCYNNYLLAKDIANFPIPVLTGIGHATNETVAEMISYKNAITPTALAGFLIQSFHNFAFPLQQAGELISSKPRELIREQHSVFSGLVKDFKSAAARTIVQNKNQLQHAAVSLFQQSRFTFNKEKERHALIPVRIGKGVRYLHQQRHHDLKRLSNDINRSALSFTAAASKDLHHFERIITSLDPAHVLTRGYSIARINGKVVNSISDAKPGDALVSEFRDGKITGRIESINEKEKQ